MDLEGGDIALLGVGTMGAPGAGSPLCFRIVI
jgi:hypothetical protein